MSSYADIFNPDMFPLVGLPFASIADPLTKLRAAVRQLIQVMKQSMLNSLIIHTF